MKNKNTLLKIAMLLVLVVVFIYTTNHIRKNISGLVIFESKPHSNELNIQFTGNGNFTYKWETSALGFIQDIKIYGKASSKGRINEN